MPDSGTIGFIGQGWIGRNYADDFERRGHGVVRYGLEPEFADRREAIASCAIVFIAVPTPTTPDGFDDSALRSALALVGKEGIAVIKSTVLPGTTEALQAAFPDLLILHAPEFLREKTAAADAAHPERNLIGIPADEPRFREAAEAVLRVLPPAAFSRVMSAREAELVKYAGNVFLALKVVYANLLHDLSGAIGADAGVVLESLGADPRIGPSHLNPVDASGHAARPGRGAGGHCLIKDLEAFRLLHAAEAHDELGDELLRAVVRKNAALLVESGKDLDLLEGVYGPSRTLP